MKRSISVILLLVLGIISVHGQKIDDEKPLYPRAGFKGGLGYTSIFGDIDDPGGRLRVHLGVVIEYPISNRFFIQGELLYSAEGYNEEIDGQKQKVSLNYIELPIIAKLYINPLFSLETGPQFGVLANVGNDDVADDDPFFNSFNDFDLGWAFGAGYKLESGLFFQLRYNLSLNNINSTDVSNRNSVAQVSIGYLFKTKNNRRTIYYEEQ